MKNLKIKEIKNGLLKKEFSAVELVQGYLERIKEKDKEIGAFLHVSQELALSHAKIIDEKIAKAEEMPELAGVPMAIKDNILVKGFKCSAGSKILGNYQAVFDATCIKKLKKAGAIFLGKTNLDEFAMGSSTENSAFKETRNPLDLERVPGGSSGGSAAAVAADESCCALGSDTGGSIRQPAAFCGLVGLKPTYGAVSRYGLIAFASSLDQIGPIAKTTEEAEIIFNIIKGKDEKDSTSRESESEVKGKEAKNLVVGLPKEYFSEGIDGRIKEAIDRTIKELTERGVKFEEISLAHSKYALACYYLISTSEASANLARYDGVKYGLSQNSSSLLNNYLETRGEGFGREVKRRIMLGTYALSAGYYDAFYLKARKIRSLIKKDFREAFEKVDLIFTPTTPSLPFKIGERIDDPLQMYLSDILTVSANLTGLPALSLPCSKTGALSVGLQIIGKPFQEREIFEAGKFIEELIKDKK